MADCDTPTLSVPTLTCAADLVNWATDFVASMQAAINHVTGCIQDFEYPTCDICVIKDDLVNCPLVVDMMDFTDIAWADEGGIGVLPYPPTVGDYEFRHGSSIITPAYSEAWRSVAIVFDTPFSNELRYVGVTVTQSGGGGACAVVGGNDYAIIVRDKTVTGCTVWIFRQDITMDCTVSFDYFAVGT